LPAAVDVRKRRVSGFWALALVSACSPELIVGTWSDPSEGGVSGAGEGGAGGAAAGGAGAGGAGAGGAGAGGAGAGGAGAGGAGAGGAGAGGAAAGAGGAGAGAGGCAATAGSAGLGLAPTMPVLTPVTVPWMTGFENEFCDFEEGPGFCYVEGDSSLEIVATPAHLGARAAAFTVNSEEESAQSRCVRQGTFPEDAIYSAWFNVPAIADMPRLWNLMFFRGGYDAGPDVKLWDVSIGSAGAGNGLYIFDHVRGDILREEDAPEIPVDTWFHVEFRFRRAADETGVVALYQDSVLIYETPPLATDDTTWGQWFVGNLSEGRNPPDSTIYMDDVSISVAP
jgi:hypothetical protein